MSLSGNLGFVSLDEVLRLLNRSNQRGLVEVQGEGVVGRIFFDRGVTLATTLGDEDLSALIARSGITEGPALSSLLREMAVETLYQLSAHGTRFEVVEQRAAPVTAGAPFELEELIGDARRRFDEWAEVTAVVTDLDTLLKLRRDLGDRDRVTIDRDAWRLLSEVGHGSTVRSLARELGATEFWAAKVAAGMIGEELLDLEAAPVGERERAEQFPAEPSPSPDFAHAPAEESVEVTAVEPVEEPVFAEVGAEEESPSAATGAEPDFVDPNQSWWKEPEAGEAPAAAPDEAAPDAGVEEDTEAFLEKVFSGLDDDSQPDEGYGLLRRRRLGALRDLSNDS